ncbi:MAG TPA: hypothetical protein VG759_14990 [Candidatus Angelobacter sp.]|jgi:hypothetical protein|nr:hypothetical protein [Candidatus Angelobacter sp.]
MRRLTCLILPSLLLLLSCLAYAYAGMAGKYTGTWTGAQSGGAIKVALAQTEKGAWSADVSFTLEDQEVKCTTVSVKVDGEKLVVVYDFSVSGLQAESTITGQLKGASLEGTYSTKAADGSHVDDGTWKASLAK